MSAAGGAGVMVWLCRTDAWTTRSAEATCLEWLDDEERARWRDFVFDADRHLYLVAHGLLRVALTDAEPRVLPGDWRFDRDAHGWPFVIGPASAGRLPRFSLSHTRGMAAVAVAGSGELGIDIEMRRAAGDAGLAAALSSFAPQEQAWVAQTPERSHLAVLRLWTLKEAYAKARGLGLQLPLDSYAFTPRERRGIESFDGPRDDRVTNRWQFFESRVGVHRLAVAYRAAPSAQDWDPISLVLTREGTFLSERTLSVRW